jgi:uncharacterized Zn finger protein (UPF0148 family)
MNKSASASGFQEGSSNRNDASNIAKRPPQSPSTSKQATKSIMSCITCNMISISDTNRIMCPYCGAFYDPNFLNIKANNKKSKKTRADAKSQNRNGSRRNSASSRSNGANSDNDEGVSESNDSDSGDSNASSRTSKKVKNFFKNLFSKRDVTKGEKKEEYIQMDDKKDKENSSENIRNNVKGHDSGSLEMKKLFNAQNVVMHLFLTLEAKDPLKIELYKRKFLKGPEEFR